MVKHFICSLALLFVLVGCKSPLVTKENNKSEYSDKLDSINYGAYLLIQENPEKAILEALKAAEMAQKVKDDYFTSVSYNILCTTYRIQSQMDSAGKYCSACLEIRRELEDSVLIAKSLIAMGNYYSKKTEFLNSMRCHQEALEIYHASGNVVGEAKAWLNIGNLIHRQGRVKEALKMLNEGIHRLNSMDNRSQVYYQILNTRGLIYMDESNLDSAIIEFNTVMNYAKESNKNVLLSKAIFNLGQCYTQKKDLNTAELHYANSLQYFDSIGNEQDVLFTQVELSKLYAEKGAYLLADSLALISLHGLEENFPNSMDLSNAYRMVANIKNELSQFDSAYFYFQLYFKKEREIFNLESDKQVSELQIQYETARKDALILQSEAEKSQLKYGISIASLLSMGLIGFIFLQYRNYKLKQQKEEAIHKESIHKLLKEEEIKTFDALLKTQEQERKRIAEDLHDKLGSVLSAASMHCEVIFEKVKDDAALRSAEKVNDLVAQALKDTRNIAHNMLSGLLTKFGLQAALKELKQSVESKDRLRINLKFKDFKGRLDLDLEISIYRIIQEGLNNVLRHSKANEVTLCIGKQEGQIVVEVQDNGVGFHTPSKSGIGLNNIKMRAESHNGKLSITSTPGMGTNLTVKIPLMNGKN